MTLQRLTLILSPLSVVLCFGGMILAHNDIVPARLGALIFGASGLVGLLAFFLGVLGLLTQRGAPAAMIGVFGLMPLVAVVSSAAGVFMHPRIADISTDTATPPPFVQAQLLPENAGRDLAFPPANAAQIQQHYPRVQPLRMNLSPQQAYERALEVAQTQKGWEITRQDPAARSFEAVATSKLFHWRDDVVVRVSPDGAGSRVDLRGRSRSGRSDMGANARRIEQYFKDLQKFDVVKPG